MGKEKTAITLGDFTVIAPEGGMWSEFSCSVGLLDAAGQSNGNYIYLDDEMAGNMGAPSAGWYDYIEYSEISGEWVDASTVEVPFGDGLMVQSDCGVKLQFSGEVIQGDWPLAVNGEDVGGFTWTGNTSPVDRMLKEFAVIAPEGGMWSEFSCSVGLLDAAGQSNGNYIYLDDEMAGNMGAPCAGWYDYIEYSEISGEWVDAGKINVPSGDALMIQSDCGVTLNVPSPFTPAPVED